MQVTNVRVSFLRERQPAQYEKATPAVEFTATLEDGEDYAGRARQLMTEATTLAYNALGYEVPGSVQAALNAGNIPAGLDVDKGVATLEPLTAERATVDGSPPPADESVAEEKPKNKGGRPVGSTSKKPRKGSKAWKAEQEEIEKAKREAAQADIDAAREREAVADEGVPDLDAEPQKPQISTNPENRVDPDDIPGDDDMEAGPPDGTLSIRPTSKDEADDIPDDDPIVKGEVEIEDAIEAAERDAAEKATAEDKANDTVELTSQDLNGMIAAAIKANKVTLPDAKSIRRNFNVARVQDLTPEQVLQARDMLEKMIAAKG